MYGNENFMHALKSPTVKAVHWSLGCWQEQVLKRLHVLKEEDIKKLDLDSNQFFTHHLLKDLLRCQSGISDWFTRPKTSSIERALILRCLLEWSFVSETAFKELCRLTNQAHPKFAATVAAADEETLGLAYVLRPVCVYNYPFSQLSPHTPSCYPHLLCGACTEVDCAHFPLSGAHSCQTCPDSWSPGESSFNISRVLCHTEQGSINDCLVCLPLGTSTGKNPGFFQNGGFVRAGQH